MIVYFLLRTVRILYNVSTCLDKMSGIAGSFCPLVYSFKNTLIFLGLTYCKYTTEDMI